MKSASVLLLFVLMSCAAHRQPVKVTVPRVHCVVVSVDSKTGETVSICEGSSGKRYRVKATPINQVDDWHEFFTDPIENATDPCPSVWAESADGMPMYKARCLARIKVLI